MLKNSDSPNIKGRCQKHAEGGSLTRGAQKNQLYNGEKGINSCDYNYTITIIDKFL